MDPIVVGVYESVRIYATIITEMMEQEENYLNGTDVIERMLERWFNGVNGNKIFIADDREKDHEFVLKSFHNKTAEFRVMRPMAVANPLR